MTLINTITGDRKEVNPSNGDEFYTQILDFTEELTLCDLEELSVEDPEEGKCCFDVFHIFAKFNEEK